MNASSWRKAADLVAQGSQANQQVQAAATAESNQLESLSLSALSADDSGLLQVTFGSEQPPHHKYTKGNFDINTRDTDYRDILPDNTRYERPFISYFSSRWLVQHTRSR